MNEELALKLQAWLDGELSGGEADRVARIVAADPNAQQLVSELKDTKLALAEGELEMPVPETRDFYWSKIERQIHREARRESASILDLFPWRKFLVPIASAAAMISLLLFSVGQFAPTAPDQIITTSEMRTFTFHDHSAHMTVVWLQERHQEPDLDFELD